MTSGDAYFLCLTEPVHNAVEHEEMRLQRIRVYGTGRITAIDDNVSATTWKIRRSPSVPSGRKYGKGEWFVLIVYDVSNDGLTVMQCLMRREEWILQE